jgi:hypothetical protein
VLLYLLGALEGIVLLPLPLLLLLSMLLLLFLPPMFLSMLLLLLLLLLLVEGRLALPLEGR